MAKNRNAMPKTTCPISRAEFAAHAKPVDMAINGQSVPLDVKEFSTGSFGWFTGGKVRINIDGKPVTCQLGVNLTVVGSKDLPQGGTDAAPAGPTVVG